jgi:hypothetical protein
MLANIIKYYEKITDLALINIKNEKKFNFKSKLNNDVMLKQSEDHLISVYKKAGGGTLSKEAKTQIDKYMNDIKEMNKLAVKDYNRTLNLLKGKTLEEKQNILNDIANRGFHGFTSKNGNRWNIETYSNMYFTHMNNQMVRQAVIDNSEYVRVSVHGTTCKLCIPWEGKTMKTIEVERTTLFHPRCKHFLIKVDNKNERVGT